MGSAFFWGLIAASSLVVGGVLASWVTIGKRTLGVIMGFGAGVLISAIAYELVYEAVHIAKLSGFPALGFFGGAFTFFFADLLIGRMGGRREGDARFVRPPLRPAMPCLATRRTRP
jgi:ZIP family zinc transporter